MFKFFRNIRKGLLKENKMGKYLAYAIGEIVLVVIGILIALQLNNLNEERKNQIAAEAYLESFPKEIEDNISVINNYLKGYMRKRMKPHASGRWDKKASLDSILEISNFEELLHFRYYPGDVLGYRINKTAYNQLLINENLLSEKEKEILESAHLAFHVDNVKVLEEYESMKRSALVYEELLTKNINLESNENVIDSLKFRNFLLKDFRYRNAFLSISSRQYYYLMAIIEQRENIANCLRRLRQIQGLGPSDVDLIEPQFLGKYISTKSKFRDTIEVRNPGNDPLEGNSGVSPNYLRFTQLDSTLFINQYGYFEFEQDSVGVRILEDDGDIWVKVE